MSDEKPSEKTTARTIGKYLLSGALVVLGAVQIAFFGPSALGPAPQIILGLICVGWGLYLFWTMKRVKR